ncbi:hypothetical protein [Frankia gtarii]|uniref:hypothetical protein n=1 Tax=Frankia gtarii TaxID=2950102 RepID=UPI0021BDF24E|nr:hypothetical protein [Frankia gtarii]
MPRDATTPSDVPASTWPDRAAPEPDALQRKLDLLDPTARSSTDSREPAPGRPASDTSTATSAAERKAALLDRPPSAPREIPAAPAELDTPAARKAALLDRAAERRFPDSADSPDTSKTSDDKPHVERPELNDKLTVIYQDSLQTPAGRAFFEPDDRILRNSAVTTRPKEGFYTADLHGNPEGFGVGDKRVDAGEFASLVQTDPDWRRQPIRLLSCSTGAGDHPVAQDVAEELGVRVEAPTGPVWVDHNGNPVVDDTEIENEYGLMETGPGTWRTFEPTRDGS